jgi:Undecaprenyl-phosphate galactose phosphotransferase WbaP
MGAKPVLARVPALPVEVSATAPAWYSYIVMLAIDIAALSIVYWLAVLGPHFITPGSLRFYVELFPGISLFVLAFFIQGLYPGLLLHPADEIRRIFYCVTSVLLMFVCTTFLWHNAQSYSRSIVLLTWMLAAPAVLFARYVARHYLARSEWWGIPAVVLGSGPVAQKVVRALANRSLGVRVTAVLDDFAIRAHSTALAAVPSARVPHSPASPVATADYAIVALTDTPSIELRHMLRDYCHGFRHVLLVPDMPGICSLGMNARDIGGDVVFEVPQRLFHRSAGIAKRGLDFIVSALALVVLSPLFLVLMLMVRLTSSGPALYGHNRYGRGGKVFKALKFRTMVQNGDQILTEYLRDNPEELRGWQRDQKLKSDPRVTPVGRLLRRYSLDELPQLWNVFVGQMSLVGPRPIVGAEISKYGQGYDLYTRVLPGITGLWQVSGRNNTTYEERVTFDEYYVRNWSIWMDAYILIRTVRTVLSAEGAY